MKITFDRLVRDCPANTKRGTERRRRIVDQRVFIDGEWRATWRRSIGNGYNLHDRDGRPICGDRADPYASARWLGAEIPNKAAMMATTLYLAPFIPTVWQLAELSAEDHRREMARIKADREAERLDRLEDSAPKLYAALLEVERAVASAPKRDIDWSGPGGVDEAMKLARAALTAADGTPR
jgi:hypothetical protein